MVQGTAKPREADPKMDGEKRVKETPGGGRTPKPEVQTARFEWPGLSVGPSSEVVFYKPNQRKPGDMPQGVQTVPAIWLPSPQGAPWPYNNANEENLVNGQPASSQPIEAPWYGLKQVVACGGLIFVLLLLFTYLDRYRILSRLRPRRWQVQNTLKVTCQMGDDQRQKPAKKPKDPPKDDMPPSYSKIDLTSTITSKDGKSTEIVPPYSCVFMSGKGKMPKIQFFDAYKDKEVLEKMGLGYFAGDGPSQRMKVNAPIKVDPNDPSKETTNFVFQINDTVNECGCIIGMDVMVDKNHEDAVILEGRNSIPFSINVEQLERVEHYDRYDRNIYEKSYEYMKK